MKEARSVGSRWPTQTRPRCRTGISSTTPRALLSTASATERSAPADRGQARAATHALSAHRGRVTGRRACTSSPRGARREAPYFSDAERAALALTEAATRLADRPDPVPDEVWDDAARHYTEPQLAALVVVIAAINAFNRVNAATRQVTGDYVARIVEAGAGATA